MPIIISGFRVWGSGCKLKFSIATSPSQAPKAVVTKLTRGCNIALGAHDDMATFLVLGLGFRASGNLVLGSKLEGP